MLISVCCDWALALGSTRSSSCLAAEVHFNGVVWLVASCWQMLICVCWDWALALGSTRSSSCLATEVQNRQAAWRKKFSCQLSGWVRCYRCVIKLLGGIRRCRAARHRQGLGGMLEAMNTGVRSSCLAGTLVALARQAVWRPGDIGVVSSNRWRRGASSISFDPALVDLFDLTL